MILKLSNHIQISAFFLLFMCFGVESYAQKIQIKTLIVESVYQIKIYELSSPVKLPIKGESRPSFATCSSESPEEIVLAYFDAMRMADVKRSNLCWAPDSLRQLQERDHQSGRTLGSGLPFPIF